MAIKTRIEPLSLDVQVAIDTTLSPKARSAFFAEFAHGAIAEASETNRRALGRVPRHDRHVDGRLNAPLESVKPEGRIVVEFHLMADVFVFILHELRRLSPVRSGRYRDSHVFFADHRQADPANPPEGASEWSFVNTQPYARKIEVGRMKMRVPGGVYEAAAASARRRFGNLARIRVGQRSAASGAVNAWASKTKLTASGRGMTSRTRAEWLRRQPAIIITI